jgi:uncharacterized protein YecA (UPF0149 family)
VIFIRTYKEMTSGEKRSLTLSMKKYADAFVKKHQGSWSGFASEADVIDTFYAEWLQDSLDSHYAWCCEKNEDSAGYTAKGYHEQEGFAEEAKAKIRDILAEKVDVASIQSEEALAQAKSQVPPSTTPEKTQPQPQVEVREKQRKKKRKDATKLGRNDVCPCGSGKKYKKCCLEDGIAYTYVRGKFVAVS